MMARSLIVASMRLETGRATGWLAVGVVLVLVLVTTAIFPQLSFSAELRPEDSDRGLSARYPIEVVVTTSGHPRVGAAAGGIIEVVPYWSSVSDVSVAIDVPSGVELISSVPAGRPGPLAESLRFPFQVVPLAPGSYEIGVRVTGTSAIFGKLGDIERVFLEVPREGEGRLSIGNALPTDAMGWVSPVGGPARESHQIPLRRGKDPGVGPSPHALPPATPAANPSVGAPPIVQSHPTFVVTGQWNYWREDDVTWAPQRWARVEVRDDDGLGAFDLLWVGTTGADGSFTSVPIDRVEPDCCGRGNQDVSVVFFTTNGGVSVQTTGGTPYSWQTAVTTIGTEDVLDVGSLASGSNRFAQRPFQYINNGWDFAVNVGGLGAILGQVRVFIPDSCTFYTLADDTIHLCADGVDDKSPDDVNHEYGHYIHDKLYRDGFWPSPGGVHSFCEDNQNRGLSWTEGFADFFGPRVQTEIVDPTDVSYSRPWDGSIFAINMESRACAGGVLGDDDEMHVAWSLWDLRDGENDGTDQDVSQSVATLMSAIDGCNQSNYRDHYDGGLCNWVSRGNSRLSFVATAWNNRIDYNVGPTVAVTSQTSFAWVRSLMTVTATASDSDTSVRQVAFRISTDNTCSDFDALVGTDTASPFSLTFDTSAISDTGTGWTCAVASDEFEPSAYGISGAFVGIDNTPPSTTHTLTGTLGGSGWFRSAVAVGLAATDALSGLSQIQVRVDGGLWTTFTDPVSVSVEGTHVVEYTARDVAGNAETTRSVVVGVDRTPPSITPIGPLPGSWTNDIGLRIAWTGADPTSGISRYEVVLDAGVPSSVIAEETTLAGVPEGAHTVLIRAFDVAGNSREATIDFSVDRIPPSATVIEPREGQLVNGTTVFVRWTSLDDRSGMRSCSLAIDGALVDSALPSSGQHTANVADGTHVIRLACEDVAGNVALSSVTFRVDTSPFSLTGPFGPWPLLGLGVGAGITAIALALIVSRRMRKRRR